MKTEPKTGNAQRLALFDIAYVVARRAASFGTHSAVARGAIHRDDRQDIEQEILIRVWLALSKFDPGRAGLRTFVEVVVRTQVTSLLRSRRPEFESLDERQCASDGGFREIELRLDIRRALAGVCQFDRAVALSLAECSAAETSRGLDISRAATYRAIGRLRVAFTAVGFGGPCRHREPRV